jgi:hypothetical protein
MLEMETMIKIDWKVFITDRVWFGYFWSPGDGDQEDEFYEPACWAVSWVSSDRWIPMQTLDKFFLKKGIAIQIWSE